MRFFLLLLLLLLLLLILLLLLLLLLHSPIGTIIFVNIFPHHTKRFAKIISLAAIFLTEGFDFSRLFLCMTHGTS